MLPTTAAPAGPGSSWGKVLRRAGYTRLLVAGIASQSGGTIANVAIIWLTFLQTGSALAVAAVGVAALAGAIGFSLPAGVWVDRYDRRRLMVLSDLVRAGAMGGLALALGLAGFSLVGVLVATFVSNAGSVIFSPAEQSLIPALVGPEELADANALVRSSRSLVTFLAAPVGGVLLLVARGELSLAYNALTFLVSAAFVFGVHPPPRPRPSLSTRRSMFEELRAGFRWLSRRALGLLELSFSALAMNFCTTLVWAFLVVYAVTALHGSSAVYGGLLAAEAAGVILGSVLVGRTRAIRHVGKVWVLAYGVGVGTATLGMVATRFVPFDLLILFAGSTLNGFAGNAWLTSAQTIVPTEMQGRYFALDNLFSWAALPAAEIVGGLLIGAWGVLAVFTLAGLGLLAAAAASALARPLWNLRGDRRVALEEPAAGGTPLP